MEQQHTDELAGANALLMSGGVKAEKYDHIGVVVGGTILGAKEDYEYEMELQGGKWVRTGDIRKWKNSNEPKKQLVITVQTELREDANDDGRRLMFFDSYRIPVLREAVQKAGGKGLAIGATIAKRWDSGSGNPGDPKVYSVGYTAPAVGAESMMSAPAAPPAAPVVNTPAAPVAQPASASPTLASMAPAASATPAAAIPPTPTGVDPALWASLPDIQRNAILAAMTPAAGAQAQF